jgi:hypothetical protein
VDNDGGKLTVVCESENREITALLLSLGGRNWW